MNVARGLFRLWLVVSVLWIVLVGVFSYDKVMADRGWAGDPWWESDRVAELPVRCENARGAANVDYHVADAAEPWNRYRTPSNACWYSEDRLKALWPEYADMDHTALSDKLYQTLGWSFKFNGDRFEHTKIAAGVGLLPPLAVLLIGAAFMWAFSGFRRATS